MYSPKFNRVDDRGILIEVMQTYSFATIFGPASSVAAPAGPAPVGPALATLTSPDPPGAVASHLPLVVKDEGEHGVIEGHFAYVNPHWQSLAGRETLVVFKGPHSYVSPALYTEELSVPTWNYIAVHAYGMLSLVEDDPGKLALLTDLIAANEPAFLDNWRALPEGFRRTMLSGIMGFRIPIARIEGKFKLSQNRKPEERSNVYVAQLAGSDDERALAQWMERLLGQNDL